jgi:hypothetical protein
MKKFTRQTSGNAPTADVNLDFGAASAKVARLFEPGEYRLRIDSARIIQNNQNVSISAPPRLALARKLSSPASRSVPRRGLANRPLTGP